VPLSGDADGRRRQRVLDTHRRRACPVPVQAGRRESARVLGSSPVVAPDTSDRGAERFLGRFVLCTDFDAGLGRRTAGRVAYRPGGKPVATGSSVRAHSLSGAPSRHPRCLVMSSRRERVLLGIARHPHDALAYLAPLHAHARVGAQVLHPVGPAATAGEQVEDPVVLAVPDLDRVRASYQPAPGRDVDVLLGSLISGVRCPLHLGSPCDSPTPLRSGRPPLEGARGSTPTPPAPGPTHRS
jgi:hypothetical protein